MEKPLFSIDTTALAELIETTVRAAVREEMAQRDTGAGTAASRLYTMAEVTKILRVSRTTMYELMEQGLPAMKVAGKWCFPAHTLEKWMNDRLAEEEKKCLGM